MAQNFDLNKYRWYVDLCVFGTFRNIFDNKMIYIAKYKMTMTESSQNSCYRFTLCQLSP